MDISDLHAQIEEHDGRIAAIEMRQDTQGNKLDDISREVSAVRAEGQARAVAAMRSMDQMQQGLQGLTLQLAEQNGAQKRQNELKQEELRTAQIKAARVKYWAGIVGIFAAVLGVIGGTIMSSQTWDTWFFGHVHFLHQYDLAQGYQK